MPFLELESDHGGIQKTRNTERLKLLRCLAIVCGCEVLVTFFQGFDIFCESFLILSSSKEAISLLLQCNCSLRFRGFYCPFLRLLGLACRTSRIRIRTRCIYSLKRSAYFMDHALKSMWCALYGVPLGFSSQVSSGSASNI
jgi:hypothetical protein